MLYIHFFILFKFFDKGIRKRGGKSKEYIDLSKTEKKSEFIYFIKKLVNARVYYFILDLLI